MFWRNPICSKKEVPYDSRKTRQNAPYKELCEALDIIQLPEYNNITGQRCPHWKVPCHFERRSSMKSALPLQAQIIYVRCVATLMATVMARDGSDTVPLLCRESGSMNFYTVDFNYVEFLKCAEEKCRGFTRVPKMDYGKERKPKFLLGVVLQVNNMDYYVPVTSYKLKN